jgi:pectate lyase
MKKFLFALIVLLALPFATFGQTYAPGDVNHSGGIDIVDALVVARYYVGLNPSNYNSAQADTNCSGGVDIVDALLIAQYYVGLIGAFPCSATAVPTATSVVTANPIAAPTATQGPADSRMVGFATMNGGTTGGKGGTTVNVSTGTAFQDAITNKGSGGLIIHITGVITPSNSSGEKIDVKDVSNVTIMNGEMNGIGIKVWRATNVIIRNVKIHHVNIGDKDAIGVQESTNVWIDHNEVSSDTANGKDYYDGAIDISHAADYVTVSFNYVHDHYKTSLVGHSDSNAAEDTGKLHVTYCGNWFNNVSARTPLLRFGTVHLFNNYMSNYFDAATACNIRMGAVTRIEGNAFVNVANPILSVDSDSIGYWDFGPGSVDTNTYSGATWATGSPASSSQTNASLNGFQDTCSYTPPYSYTLMAASQVAAYAQANAGVGKVDPSVY